jgi:hypothetical protein
MAYRITTVNQPEAFYFDEEEQNTIKNALALVRDMYAEDNQEPEVMALVKQIKDLQDMFEKRR